MTSPQVNDKTLIPSNQAPIPRKLNGGMIKALSLAIAKGNYYNTACALCDISEPTLYAWIKQGIEDETAEVESLYLTLVKALKKAEAQAEAELVKVVRNSATEKKEWLPAITFLERRHPDRWGRRERRQIDITEKRQITITRVEVILNQGADQIIEGESRVLEEGDATKQEENEGT